MVINGSVVEKIQTDKINDELELLIGLLVLVLLILLQDAAVHIANDSSQISATLPR